jgi:hypothetical protein
MKYFLIFIANFVAVTTWGLSFNLDGETRAHFSRSLALEQMESYTLTCPPTSSGSDCIINYSVNKKTQQETKLARDKVKDIFSKPLTAILQLKSNRTLNKNETMSLSFGLVQNKHAKLFVLSKSNSKSTEELVPYGLSLEASFLRALDSKP